MEESIPKFCKTLSGFCNHLQSSCDALIHSADRRPIPLGFVLLPFSFLLILLETLPFCLISFFFSFYLLKHESFSFLDEDSASTTFVQCLNRRVSSTAADLNLLESMSCDTVSFEELLGHCTQVYHHNQIHLLALRQHLISTSAYIPPSTDTDEDLDEEEHDLDNYSCINGSSLPSSEFHDDPLLDDSLSLKNLGLSDVCLATIASEGAANNIIQNEGHFQVGEKMFQEIEGEIVDEQMPFKDSKSEIDVSRVDYDCLPDQIKRLASWQELTAAIEKMNSSLTKRRSNPCTFRQDEIALLGLGDKARSYLLMLIKMNCMAVEIIDGTIYYSVLQTTFRN